MLSASNAEVQVFTRSETVDSAGSRLTAWLAVAHNVPAYMQTNSAAENNAAGGERSKFSGIARLPGYFEVDQGDRIVWAGRTLQIDAAHTVYRVAGIPDFVHAEWSEVTDAGL